MQVRRNRGLREDCYRLAGANDCDETGNAAAGIRNPVIPADTLEPGRCRLIIQSIGIGQRQLHGIAVIRVATFHSNPDKLLPPQKLVALGAVRLRNNGDVQHLALDFLKQSRCRRTDDLHQNLRMEIGIAA